MAATARRTGLLERARHHVLELLYPSRCVGCGAFGTLLCESCVATFEPATGPGRCRNCSARWAGDDYCPRCFHVRAADRLVAAVEMAGAARKAVHALKYQRVRAIAPELAGKMHELRSVEGFDSVLAVPLHASRRRSRGFNQAEELLRTLAWEPAPGKLRRVRRTASQVGHRERERRANVADAFDYRGESLRGMAVAVVDDVITTGATMDECARVLKEAGARRVVGVAFARASYAPGVPDAPIAD